MRTQVARDEGDPRRNSSRHLLSGDGVVVAEGDAEAIRVRVEALTAKMQPRSAAGVILIGTMATLSVRMKHAAGHDLDLTHCDGDSSGL